MQTIESIRQHIAEIAAKSPLAAGDVAILGASKGQPIAVLEGAIRAGMVDFGENRVQEAYEKWPALKKQHPEVRLHLIGSLQTNKVADALALFDVIQTLDRPKLADEIANVLSRHIGIRQGALGKSETTNTHATRLMPHAFYIQVNTGEEPQKSGVSTKEAGAFIEYCKKLELNVVGLMCVPPANEMPAPHFALLKRIAAEHGLTKLSMGMSNDYETAIRMGSTCVRLGRALFGERA